MDIVLVKERVDGFLRNPGNFSEEETKSVIEFFENEKIDCSKKNTMIIIDLERLVPRDIDFPRLKKIMDFLVGINWQGISDKDLEYIMICSEKFTDDQFYEIQKVIKSKKNNSSNNLKTSGLPFEYSQRYFWAVDRKNCGDSLVNFQFKSGIIIGNFIFYFNYCGWYLKNYLYSIIKKIGHEGLRKKNVRSTDIYKFFSHKWHTISEIKNDRILTQNDPDSTVKKFLKRIVETMNKDYFSKKDGSIFSPDEFYCSVVQRVKPEEERFYVYSVTIKRIKGHFRIL